MSDAEPARPDLPGRLLRLCDERYAIVLAFLLLALAAHSWSSRFVLDDAFISFRYARNLVDGNGLVFNPGERVEGFTNFLWTLLMSVPIRFGIDPVTACYAIGPVLAALTLWLTAESAWLLTGSRALGLLVVILTGTNPSFAHFATGGLETMLVTCLQMGLVWVALRAYRRRSVGAGAAAGASVLAALAFLTRMDSLLVTGIGLAAMAIGVLISGPTPRGRPITVGLLLGPAAILTGAWLAWRLSYYGSLLPNTFQAKLGEGPAWGMGFTYLDAFFTSTFTLPFLFLIAGWARKYTAPVACLAIALAATLVYLAAAGGDFMEFRLLVPAIPILILLIAWAVFRDEVRPEIRISLALLLLAGSIHHEMTFRYVKGIDSVEALGRHLNDPSEDWAGIGKDLGRLFGGASDLSIATSACGAIPYYSRLYTIDMLGLSDAWVARNGIRTSFPPGHMRAAPFGYLVRRQVNLVLGHPWVIGPDSAPEDLPEGQGLRGFGYVLEIRPGDLLPSASLLLLPLGEGRSLVTLYLRPHPAIEGAIAAHGWKRLPIPEF